MNVGHGAHSDGLSGQMGHGEVGGDSEQLHSSHFSQQLSHGVGSQVVAGVELVL